VSPTTSLPYVPELARVAERGLFDLLFIAASTSVTSGSTPFDIDHFEPITIRSAVASCTRHIGLVGTMFTSYSQPFATARQIASLDMLSGGRAGWNAVTSSMVAVRHHHVAPSSLGLEVVFSHQAAELLAVHHHALMAKRSAHAPVAIALELVADRADPAEQIAGWGRRRAVIERRTSQAHQLASPAGGSDQQSRPPCA
jgi:hypothetical protein